MAVTTRNALTDLFRTRFSLTSSVQLATRQLGVYTAYFAALVGIILALQKLKSPIAETFETDSPALFYSIALAPLVAVLVFHSVPSLVKRIRRHRRDAAIIRGQLKEGYCRLIPLGEDSQDSFDRADGIHQQVLNWIRRAQEPILYLSGMSGCGKSSLLSAFVLPRLRKGRPAYLTLTVRGFGDPLQALQHELARQGLINDSPEVETMDGRTLLAAACKNLGGVACWLYSTSSRSCSLSTASRGKHSSLFSGSAVSKRITMTQGQPQTLPGTGKQACV